MYMCVYVLYATLRSTAVQYTSSRGFVTYTGKFQGVLVSIIVTLMGYPNMDFVIREVG